MRIINLDSSVVKKFDKFSENQLFNFMATSLLESISKRQERMKDFRLSLMYACNKKIVDIPHKLSEKIHFMLFGHSEIYKQTNSFCIWDELDPEEKTSLYDDCMKSFNFSWDVLQRQYP